MADNPSGAMNTASAPDPDPGGDPNMGGNPDTGGDLAAAIALLAQTLATQNVHPPPTPHAVCSTKILIKLVVQSSKSYFS